MNRIFLRSIAFLTIEQFTLHLGTSRAGRKSRGSLSDDFPVVYRLKVRDERQECSLFLILLLSVLDLGWDEVNPLIGGVQFQCAD
jgi:hypothetical protein